MNIDKPECWMIAISDNPISMYYKNEVLSSWTDRGFVVNHFEAITPKDLHEHNLLNLTLKRAKVEFTETERAVWYSHYMTWKLCWDIQKPIIVIEHDILLLQDIPSEAYAKDIACLAHVKRDNGRRAKLAGGSYFITPKGARELRCARHMKSIKVNSDSWIHEVCDKYGKWFERCSIQMKDEKIGVTVEHNK
jgi:GR25 family glycosyltransferase involved in LPS biosynthesis